MKPVRKLLRKPVEAVILGYADNIAYTIQDENTGRRSGFCLCLLIPVDIDFLVG